MYSLFLAIRYIRANAIMGFAVAGVTIGIAVLIVVTSLMGGFSRDLRERIRGMQSHLMVVPDRDSAVADDGLIEAIRKIPDVKAATARLDYAAWMGVRGSRRPVRLIGIDAAAERGGELEPFFLRGGVDLGSLQGAWAVPGWELPIETGAPCAFLTAREVEDGSAPAMILATPRSDLTFTAAGRFRSGLWEYDTSVVFLSIDRLRDFLRLEGPASSMIAVSVDDYDARGREVRSAIVSLMRRQKLNGLVRSWEDVQANFLQAVESEKVIQYFILAFIAIAALFTILSIYMMMVRAKLRDIGILKAQGGTGTGILGIFVLSGMACGVAGSVFGILLGLFVATSLDGFTLHVRMVSRGLAALPRWETWAALVCFLAAGIPLVASWRRLYSAPSWKWKAAAAAVIVAGLHFYMHWSRGFVPDLDVRETGAFAGFSLGSLAWLFISLLLLAVRAPLPSTIGHAGIAAWLLLSAGIAASVAFADLAPGFRGFDLFPRQVYRLDRVPVMIDGGWLATIVAMALGVGAVATVVPAWLASRYDPLEMIRNS